MACLSGKEPSAIIELELYESEKAKARKPIVVTFDGVETYHATANASALLDHASAGNISFCHVDGRPGVVSLSMHLVDGYLRIVAKRARLSRGVHELR
jgi:hypothetical protein